MKPSPFVIYFAGVGTVVAALAVGFGGGLFLTHTSVVKETPAMSAAKLERLRSMKPETAKVENADAGKVAETAKPAEQPPSLLATTTGIPVDVKAPADTASATPAPNTPPGAPAASAPTQQVAAVQGQASFEGPDNAVDVQLGDKPIAEPRKERRSRSSQQRKTREVIAESRQRIDADREPSIRTHQVLRENPRVERDDLADQDSERETRVVTRTYESRSRSFGGFFTSEED